MIHFTPAANIPRNLTSLLDEVRLQGDSVLITEDGKPVAALIDIGLLGRLCGRGAVLLEDRSGHQEQERSCAQRAIHEA